MLLSYIHCAAINPPTAMDKYHTNISKYINWPSYSIIIINFPDPYVRINTRSIYSDHDLKEALRSIRTDHRGSIHTPISIRCHIYISPFMHNIKYNIESFNKNIEPINILWIKS